MDDEASPTVAGGRYNSHEAWDILAATTPTAGYLFPSIRLPQAALYKALFDPNKPLHLPHQPSSSTTSAILYHFIYFYHLHRLLHWQHRCQPRRGLILAIVYHPPPIGHQASFIVHVHRPASTSASIPIPRLEHEPTSISHVNTSRRLEAYHHWSLFLLRFACLVVQPRWVTSAVMIQSQSDCLRTG